MDFLLAYLKDKLMFWAAVASGQCLRNTVPVMVHVKTKSSQVMLVGIYNEVVYQFGETKRTVINLKLRNEEADVNKLVEAGLRSALLDKCYRFSGDAELRRSYHITRFEEILNKK